MTQVFLAGRNSQNMRSNIHACVQEAAQPTCGNVTFALHVRSIYGIGSILEKRRFITFSEGCM